MTWQDFLCFIISIFVHEFAHLLVASKFSFLQGSSSVSTFYRLAKCLDIFGMIVVPLISFNIFVNFLNLPLMLGWAKAIPIKPIFDPQHKSKIILIAGAGAASNFLLALILFPISVLLADGDYHNFINRLIVMNCILGTFSLMPFGKLDGALIGRMLFSENALHFIRVSIVCGLLVMFTL